MLIDFSKIRLNLKPRRDDKRTIWFGSLVRPTRELPPPNFLIDYMAGVPEWPMFDNDVEGDCALAGIGHAIQMWTNAIGHMVVPQMDELQRVYRTLSPKNDGIVLLDLLNYWRKHPICGFVIPAYYAVDPSNVTDCELVLQWSGALYTGLQLPLIAQTDGPWDVIPNMNDPRAKPGSWGGHCVPYGYRAIMNKIWRCVTWGSSKDVSDAFWDEYMTLRAGAEAYGIVAPDWFGPSGKCPSGFNIASLENQLRQVS